MTKISVILPVYNAELTIKEAIDSIIRQTEHDWELIVINDGSQDSTEQIVQSYVDSRIKYFKNNGNKGLVFTLNRGISLSNGVYIARMDADDISLPARFEKQLTYIVEHRLDLIGCETTRTDISGKVFYCTANRSYSSNTIRRTLRFDNCIAHPTWFGKKEVFEKLGGYREISTCEDYDFLLRAVKNNVKLGICNSNLFIYRDNSYGISCSNVFKQKMTASYLQHNFKRIETVSQMEIDDFVNKQSKNNAEKRYIESLLLLDKGQKELRFNLFVGLYNVFSALLKSRLISKRVYNLIVISVIRIFD